MEAWNPQCHWSSLGAEEAEVGVEAPGLSEARGLGAPSQVGGYLMTLARRVQVIKKKKPTQLNREVKDYEVGVRERTRKGNRA